MSVFVFEPLSSAKLSTVVDTGVRLQTYHVKLKNQIFSCFKESPKYRPFLHRKIGISALLRSMKVEMKMEACLA